MANESRWDLDERLLEFAAQVVRFSDSLPRTAAGRHVSGQLLRSGTAPMAHHAEAQSAESRKDFLHKMKIALKELRESHRWIALAQRVPLIENPESCNPLLQETDELIRIFVASVKTARANLGKERQNTERQNTERQNTERRTSNAEH